MRDTSDNRLYFTGTSEMMKIDDKERLIVPRHVQHGEVKDVLVVIRAVLDEDKVLALTEAEPFFTQAQESVRYMLPFVRSVSQDKQRRIKLTKDEVEHIDSREVLVFGLGRVALVAAEKYKQNIVGHFMRQLAADNGQQESPTIDMLLSVTATTAELPTQK